MRSNLHTIAPSTALPASEKWRNAQRPGTDLCPTNSTAIRGRSGLICPAGLTTTSRAWVALNHSLQPFARSMALRQRPRRSARSAASIFGSKRTSSPRIRRGPQLFRAGPETRRQSCQIGRAQRGGLRHLRPHHRHTQHIRLELHQQIVHRRAAIHAQRGQRRRSRSARPPARRPPGRRCFPEPPAQCVPAWCRGAGR